jgi:AraC-like DNA-binding protein
MDADIHTLYTSAFYRIIDFKCRCTECGTSQPEYNQSFSISFVRTGNFFFNVFRKKLDSYNGCVLVTKPHYERTVTHVTAMPDECTIFDFTLPFYEQLCGQHHSLKFLFDNDQHGTLVKVDAEAELLHFRILQLVQSGHAGRLEIDTLVLDMIGSILGKVGEEEEEDIIAERLKRHHLYTIEKAKQYISLHFQDDISLSEMAQYCNVSLFHFARIFKTFTAYTPHQFLLGVRLKHAELLLKDTSLPVLDIAIASGFNSTEHFTAAFSKKYKCPPQTYRLQRAKVIH